MKRLIPLLLVIWLGQGSAFALSFPFGPSLAPAPQLNSAQPAEKCPDFSGHWKGDCSDGKDVTKDVTTDIKQTGCYYFASGSDTYYVGGFKTETQIVPPSNGMSPGFVSNSTINIEWSADRSTLLLHGNLLLQNLPDATGIPVQITGNYRRDGDVLRAELQSGTWKQLCQLKKQ